MRSEQMNPHPVPESDLRRARRLADGLSEEARVEALARMLNQTLDGADRLAEVVGRLTALVAELAPTTASEQAVVDLGRDLLVNWARTRAAVDGFLGAALERGVTARA